MDGSAKLPCPKPAGGAGIQVVRVVPAAVLPPVDVFLTAGAASPSTPSLGTGLAVLEVVTAPIFPLVDIFAPGAAMGPETALGARSRPRRVARVTAARCRRRPFTRTLRDGDWSLRPEGGNHEGRVWHLPLNSKASTLVQQPLTSFEC